MNQRPDLAELPSLISQTLDMSCCASCEENLALPRTQTKLICQSSKLEFAINNGRPLLFWPNEWNGMSNVTEPVSWLPAVPKASGFDE